MANANGAALMRASWFSAHGIFRRQWGQVRQRRSINESQEKTVSRLPEFLDQEGEGNPVILLDTTGSRAVFVFKSGFPDAAEMWARASRVACIVELIEFNSEKSRYRDCRTQLLDSGDFALLNITCRSFWHAFFNLVGICVWFSPRQLTPSLANQT
jgi:hypothetical protein